MTNPHEPGRISVTLKQDGKDGTWVVFHGSPEEVRQQIVGLFPEFDGQTDAPLYDLINEATRLFKAAGNVSSRLGGRVVGNKAASGNESSDSGSAWDRVAGNGAEPQQEPEVDPNVARLQREIEGAADVAALRELFARNKAAFDANPDLVADWKAKGKSLS